jgi:hypothetical protein
VKSRRNDYEHGHAVQEEGGSMTSAFDMFTPTGPPQNTGGSPLRSPEALVAGLVPVTGLSTAGVAVLSDRRAVGPPGGVPTDVTAAR